MQDDIHFTLNAISSKDMMHRLVDELPDDAVAVLVTMRNTTEAGHYAIDIGRYAVKIGPTAVMLVGLMQTAAAWFAHKLFIGEDDDL